MKGAGRRDRRGFVSFARVESDATRRGRVQASGRSWRQRCRYEKAAGDDDTDSDDMMVLQQHSSRSCSPTHTSPADRDVRGRRDLDSLHTPLWTTSGHCRLRPCAAAAVSPGLCHSLAALCLCCCGLSCERAAELRAWGLMAVAVNTAASSTCHTATAARCTLLHHHSLLPQV